jgi:hypothetical protein
MSFKVSNLLNRPSVKPIANSFSLRTFTVDPFAIDLGLISDATGLTLTTAAFSAIALDKPVTPIVVGALDTYSFKITSANGIYANLQGMLEAFFPSEIKIATAGSPTCTAIATMTNLNCVVNTASQSIEI